MGLGNPGKEYANTRHNVGFKIVDRVAKECNFRFQQGKGPYRIARGAVDDVPVILAKPHTYMNLSGEAVGDLVNRYTIDPAGKLLIICDDLNLPLGRVRFRCQGSDGGNKGLRSIIKALQTSEFPRLRIGIRPSIIEDKYSEFVLSHFGGDEYPLVERVIKTAADGVFAWIRSDIQTAMNLYNHITIEQQ